MRAAHHPDFIAWLAVFATGIAFIISGSTNIGLSLCIVAAVLSLRSYRQRLRFLRRRRVKSRV